MGRRAISITLAVVCLAVLLGVTGLFALSRETSYMQDDPNILILEKENGEEFGTIHVAYISRRRNQGQIYLIKNTKVTRFYLVSTDPAFTVESGDADTEV